MKKIIDTILFLLSITCAMLCTNLVAKELPFDKLLPTKIIREVEKGIGIGKTVSFWLNIKKTIVKWSIISLIILIAIILAIIIFKIIKKRKQKS